MLKVRSGRQVVRELKIRGKLGVLYVVSRALEKEREIKCFKFKCND